MHSFGARFAEVRADADTGEEPPFSPSRAVIRTACRLTNDIRRHARLRRSQRSSFRGCSGSWPVLHGLGFEAAAGELIAGSGRFEHDGGGGALVEVFERFTDRARRVVVLAQEEARMLNHNYLGTEHILLGLIGEGEGVAAKALESLGISLETVRQQVVKIIGRGQQAPPGHIPFTPRAKKVMGLASREALHLGHNYVGTEHILLGLIREGEGVAAQVLVKLGADLNRVRQQVIQLLHGYQGEQPADDGPRRGKRARARLMDEALAQIDALDRRLAAIEHWVGMRPDLADVDQEIAQVRREKEAVIDAQDFEAAAALRGKEKDLLTARASREKQWAATADRPSLAAEFKQVNAELERMRAILRDRGLDTDNGAA
jgi:ATP-dependent Clp protease ATP-binding subunit ClpC